MKSILIISILTLSVLGSFATLTTPSLVAPANGSVGNIPSVMLDWGTSTGATWYEYKLGTDPGLTTALAQSTGTNTYIYTSNLSFGTVYYWQVRAKSATDSSAWSGIWSFTVLDGITLAAPANNALNQIPDVQLDWTGISGITYYDYQADTTANFNSPLLFSGSVTTSTSYVYASNLRFGTKYYWRARARHAADTTQWSTVWAFTTTDVINLALPANNALSQTPDVQLDWTGISGITNYDYQADTTANFNSPLLFSGSVTNSTSYVYASNLRFGTKYYWRARARHAADTTQWSTVWAFTTTDIINLALPANNALSQTPDVQLDWTGITGITNYDYQADTTTNFNSPLLFSGSTASSSSYVYASNLRFGTKYYWRARARHAADTTQWSSVWAFTTTDVINLAAPTNNAVNQTPDVQLDWTGITGITNYDYQADTTTNFNSPLLFSGSTASSSSYVYASNLRFGTKYYWRARARHAADTTQWSTIWAFTTTDVLTNVGPLNGSTSQSVDAVIDWSALSGITNYDYEIDTTPAFTSPLHSYVSIGSSSSQSTMSDLRFNTTYFWHARARHSTDTTQWSPVWSFTVMNYPSLVSPVNNATGVSLNPIADWSATTGVTNYHYEFADNPQFSGAQYFSIGSGTSQATLSNLSYGTTYYWHVRNAHTTDTSDWSPAWSFTTLYQMTSGPLLISPVNLTTGLIGTVGLEWGSVGGAVSYQYQYDTDNAFPNPVTGNSFGLTATTSTLISGTTYYWRVRANNGSGYSPWSTVWSFTMEGLAVPSLVSPADGSTGIAVASVLLDWDDVATSTGYEYEYADNPGFTGSVSAWNGPSGATIGPLLYGTTYYWRVRATDGTNLTAWSVVWNFTTSEMLTPVLISPADGSTAIPVTGQILNWDDVPGITEFEVQYGTDPGFGTFTQETVSASETSLSGLDYLTVYYWRVRSEEGGQYSSWTTAWSFTTEDIGSGIQALSESQYFLYPNPSSDNVIIEGLNPGDEISVLSLTGQVVFRATSESGDMNLKLEAMSSGFYSVVIKSEKGIVVLKLVVR